MNFFHKRESQPPTKEKPPETKNEVKFFGNFKIESEDKEDKKTILLSGGEITVLVDPKTEKIILRASETLSDKERQLIQYSYLAGEAAMVGNNKTYPGKLTLSNPESAATIEQTTKMSEEKVRGIIESRIKHYLSLGDNSPDQTEKPSMTPARESIQEGLSQKNQKKELGRIRKLIEIEGTR